MKIIAHRGFSSRVPENTMAAFIAAIEFGVDGLELDIHLCRDGELIICHDEKVDRTTNGHGLIKDLVWAEIQRFNAGGWFDQRFTGEKIPRLPELLELVKGTDLLVNIELKTDVFPYPGIEEKVCRLLKNYGLVEQCLISSFNHYSLVKITAICPELKTGALYSGVLYQPWNYAKTFEAAALHPQHYSVTSELLVQAKRHNLTVNTWTVDDPPEMVRLIKTQIDGLITNRPDVARAVWQQTNNQLRWGG